MGGNKLNTDKFISHLNQKWENRPCPMCNARKWNISDTVYELREFHSGKLVLGNGGIIPVVPVTCMNCGNSIFVNALISGDMVKPKNVENGESK